MADTVEKPKIEGLRKSREYRMLVISAAAKLCRTNTSAGGRCHVNEVDVTGRSQLMVAGVCLRYRRASIEIVEEHCDTEADRERHYNPMRPPNLAITMRQIGR
jgi:hypothetical protein